MANEEHLAILKQGVEAWNRWRKANPDIRPDLRKADLRRRDLYGAYLCEVNLTGADLAGADLHKANLNGADLHRANLTAADLHRASIGMANLYKTTLGQANISEGIFSGAALVGTIFFDSNLSGADLSETVMAEATFANVDLSQAKGLDKIRHRGPCTIGIDTVYRSGGNIPEVFLRGCGVPDTFITFARSLVGEPVEFYSCFISYSTKNQDLAKRLQTDLQAKGVRCWFAPEDLKIGDPFRQRIDEAIRLHDKLLLILSEHSVASDWVEKEVETAFEKERRHKKLVLFPVRMDDAVMETDHAWAADIRRTRHIGDFRDWKDHDCYQKAFDRLLRNLKQEGVKE